MKNLALRRLIRFFMNAGVLVEEIMGVIVIDVILGVIAVDVIPNQNLINTDTTAGAVEAPLLQVVLLVIAIIVTVMLLATAAKTATAHTDK